MLYADYQQTLKINPMYQCCHAIIPWTEQVDTNKETIIHSYESTITELQYLSDYVYMI